MLGTISFVFPSNPCEFPRQWQLGPWIGGPLAVAGVHARQAPERDYNTPAHSSALALLFPPLNPMVLIHAHPAYSLCFCISAFFLLPLCGYGTNTGLRCRDL